jgi:hypothetical protein
MKELGVKYLFILCILFSFSGASYAGPVGNRTLFSSKKAVKKDSPGCRSVKRAKEKKGGYKLEKVKGGKFKGFYCYKCKKGAKKESEETLVSKVLWKHKKGGKNLEDEIKAVHVKCAAKPGKKKKVKKIKCYYCKDGKVKKHKGRYETCDDLKADKKLEIELFKKRKDAKKACKGKDNKEGKKKKMTCYFCNRRGKIKSKKFRNIKTCSDKNKSKKKYYNTKEDDALKSCGKSDGGDEKEYHCYACYKDSDGKLEVKKVTVDNKRCKKAKVTSSLEGLILAGSKKLHRREKAAQKLCLKPMKCYLCDPTTKKVKKITIQAKWRSSKDLRTKKCENFGDKRGILQRVFKKSVYKQVFGRNNRNWLGKVKKGEFKNFEDMFIYSTVEQAKKSPLCNPKSGGKDEPSAKKSCKEIMGANYRSDVPYPINQLGTLKNNCIQAGGKMIENGANSGVCKGKDFECPYKFTKEMKKDTNCKDVFGDDYKDGKIIKTNQQNTFQKMCKLAANKTESEWSIPKNKATCSFKNGNGKDIVCLFRFKDVNKGDPGAEKENNDDGGNPAQNNDEGKKFDKETIKLLPITAISLVTTGVKKVGDLMLCGGKVNGEKYLKYVNYCKDQKGVFNSTTCKCSRQKVIETSIPYTMLREGKFEAMVTKLGFECKDKITKVLDAFYKATDPKNGKLKVKEGMEKSSYLKFPEDSCKKTYKEHVMGATRLSGSTYGDKKIQLNGSVNSKKTITEDIDLSHL